LTRKEFELLAALVATPGRVYGREELLDLVWGHDGFVEPRTVDVHVARLRAKFTTANLPAPGIETVRGVGYRFRDSDPAKRGCYIRVTVSQYRDAMLLAITHHSTERGDCMRSAVAGLTLLLAGWLVQSASAQTLINGAGATFPYPIYSKWFDEYAKVDPEVRFNY